MDPASAARYEVHPYITLAVSCQPIGVTMNAETIREYLRREPFEPFVIRMSNGEMHEIAIRSAPL